MESEVFTLLREGAAGLPRPRGMQLLVIARRRTEGSTELVATSIWDDVEAIRASMGAAYQEPHFFPALDALVEDPSVAHFETVLHGWEDLLSEG
ncbi:MAG TPA: hypothetical protein VGO64_01880 [Candidatus Limnocylindrales bacterium]|jgi:hypothetical protein|nr:hypothetical protein [Candidatus Limnocylindrales bacterium]